MSEEAAIQIFNVNVSKRDKNTQEDIGLGFALNLSLHFLVCSTAFIYSVTVCSAVHIMLLFSAV